MAETRQRDRRLWKLVYCKYVTRNGKRIYPQKAKAFRFWIRIK